MQETTIRKSSFNGAGEVYERGFVRVVFQQGIPTEVGVNGCRIQDVLEVAKERLEHYQSGKLACFENEEALHHINQAIRFLNERIERRQAQGVFLTMQQHKTIRTEDLHEDFSATGA